MIKTSISILAEGFENKSLSKQFSFSLLRVEILAGLTVAIALVPEAVAFAFVAGVEPLVGLYAAFIVGLIIEFTVVQKLYRRPLESLLATWGISIILIQTTRLIFGDNIGVNSPEFLRGGYELMNGLILPYNRLFIILMCIVSLLIIYYLFGRTSLGPVSYTHLTLPTKP